MNLKLFLDELSSNGHPIALGGCRAEKIHYDYCDYNIVIFDQKDDADSIIQIDDGYIQLHHGNLDETRIEILHNYQNLEVISDPKWELKIFLSKIKEKKESISKAYYKKCIIESQVCISRSKDSLKVSDPFSSCWIKCAAYFLVDAILILNDKQFFPVHTLDIIRNLKSSKSNDYLSLITECLGLERSTNSLLSRMLKSTQGFSDLIEKNNHSEIIKNKADFLIKNSLLSDCYFYLGNINRNNFYKIKDVLNKYPELIHILKIGFDLENDNIKTESQITILTKIISNLLKNPN
jgi:hypothetical protein